MPFEGGDKKRSPSGVALLSTTWRFVVLFVDVRIERLVHAIDVDVFHYAPPAPFTPEVSSVVQLLSDLPLRSHLVATKIERARWHQIGTGQRLEPKLRKVRVDFVQVQLLIVPRWWAIEVKVGKVWVRGR